MKLIELQMDRIVGPTHHFAGLGVGNVASKKNQGKVSNPRAAALQGLDKMRAVAQLGVPQLILPPQSRPDFQFLRQMGFDGTDAVVIQRAAKESPTILSAAASSSAMWTANAATVAASVDGDLNSAVMTIANLSSSLHRSIEPSQTYSECSELFPKNMRVVKTLSGGFMMRDEGAANHMRLGSHQALPGVHVFVYGDQHPGPKVHVARQSLAACQTIARLHRLPSENTFFIKQHPEAIDAGAFHNDVVAASHHHLVLHHERAFWQAESTWENIANRYREIYGRDLTRIQVSEQELSLADAIATYLFNSQIVSPSDADRPILFCPTQVAEHEEASAIARRLVNDKHFDDVQFMELRESMAGGGGPACLRLRIPLTEDEISAIHHKAVWTPKLDVTIRNFVQDSYPESLSFDDLSDPDYVSDLAKVPQILADLLDATY